jgi:hypothetical protein
MALPQVHRFTASPSIVETGGACTVSWKVTIPDTTVVYQLKLNGQVIAAIGQKSFPNLTQTTEFMLSASTEHNETVLRKTIVHVYESGCRDAPVVDPFLIIQPIKHTFNDRFSGNGQFSLRGNGTVVTLGVSTIDIKVPMEIHVEDWFNADMDIAIKLEVKGGGGHPVGVRSIGVSLNVSWSFLEHVPSLGCTHFVETGMTRLGQAFIEDIVESEVVPKIARAFNDHVDKFIKDAQDADPQHRMYVLASFYLRPEGMGFKVCPA